MTSSGFVHEAAQPETNEWYTPRWVFDRLGVTFDLDPCSPADDNLSNVPAHRRFSASEDGLLHPWPADALVFCNPPYGDQIGDWIERMARHRNGIALTFARVDTAWFHDWCASADLICFVRGRIRFLRNGTDPANSPGAGSMFVAWGETAAKIVLDAELGLCVRPWVSAGGVPDDQFAGYDKTIPELPYETPRLPLFD